MRSLSKHILRLAELFVTFALLSQLGRTLFVLVHGKLFADATAGGIFGVFLHGLPQDMSVAGYVSAIPGLMLVLSVITGNSSKIFRWFWYVYAGVVSLILSAIFVGDMALYSYWNFRLDFTAVFYLMTSVKDAMASVAPWVVVVAVIVVLLIASAIFYVLTKLFLRKLAPAEGVSAKAVSSILMLLCAGLLFLPIRGGLGPTVMNPSKAYFSDNQRLNHAAVNPVFNLVFSLSHQGNFGKQFRFMDAAEAAEIMSSLVDAKDVTQVPDLLTPASREISNGVPDVILVMLESFSNHLMPSLGGEAVAVNLDRIAAEGLLFTNFYANSFRTDRATPAIISGFPSQPNTSIMKHTEKIEDIYSIPKSLRDNGWSTGFYYGGDPHFTNLLAYLYACRFEKIIAEPDFTKAEVTGHWGANDRALFNRFLKDYLSEDSSRPRFRIVQTSSSHEPFDVPDYHVFDNPKTNAFSYTDDCLGEFVDTLKHSGKWDDILMIIVADHYAAYPEHDSLDVLQRHQIPLVFTGGALALKGRNDRYASQIDIAATLLHQLGVPHDEFYFSKNMLNPLSPEFAFFTEVSLGGMVSKDNQYVFNCESNSTVLDAGEQPGKHSEDARAYLQTLYDALEAL